MRTSLITTASVAFGIGLATTAAAQQEVATAPVSATVQAVTLITVTGATDFGVVPNYQHDAIVSPTQPASGQSTALFSVPHPTTQQLDIRLADTCPVTLVRAGGTETMRFFARFADTIDDVDQQFAHANFECFLGGFHSPRETDVTRQFWLGGRLEVNVNQAPGTYSGTYQVSVAVVSF